MRNLNKIKNIAFSTSFVLLISFFMIHMDRGNAHSACVSGNGYIINDVGWFSIDACTTGTNDLATGTVYFEGRVVHSGSRNSLVGSPIRFDGTISKLTINGPYAGYEGSGTLTLCDQNNNCSGYAATLFPSGSNVKDTARQVGGYTRGFDDFNISIVYGDNLFVTVNGFVEYCYADSNAKKDCITVTP